MHQKWKIRHVPIVGLVQILVRTQLGNESLNVSMMLARANMLSLSGVKNVGCQSIKCELEKQKTFGERKRTKQYGFN
jgi:hypothetical protein